MKFKDPVRSKIVINVRHYKRSYIFSTRDGRLSCERDHGVRNKINFKLREGSSRKNTKEHPNRLHKVTAITALFYGSEEGTSVLSRRDFSIAMQWSNKDRVRIQT